MPQGNETKLRQRRLDPELRKQLILDGTANLVAREGVSAVSMARVGKETGVSKALIYAYFKNQKVLLLELLLREQKNLADQQTEARGRATSFDELIELTTRTYLQHVEARGLHVQRLMNEPGLAQAFHEVDRKDHEKAVNVIADEIAETFKVPSALAKRATELSMGLTGAAGNMISRNAMGVDDATELSLTLLKGAVSALKEKYGVPDN